MNNLLQNILSFFFILAGVTLYGLPVYLFFSFFFPALPTPDDPLTSFGIWLLAGFIVLIILGISWALDQSQPQNRQSPKPKQPHPDSSLRIYLKDCKEFEHKLKKELKNARR